MAFKYELKIGAKIGEGHFGDVHVGTDNVHGKVAVKVLRQSPFESTVDWDIRKETLLKEAQNLKAAEHENIVRVHTVVRSDVDNNLHMVVEFCDKGSLQNDYERGPMTLARVRHILIDVCRGLGCVHTRGMVHRDIKPGNLLCAGRRLKVGDFGLVSDSLILGYASEQGYTDHLAPEVHRDGLTSIQTDVWALGMTAYRLLQGHPFYQEEVDDNDISTSVQNGGFALHLPWLPHIPKTWRMFVRKSMHDDTAQRFKTAFEMAQAVAALPIEPEWKCVYTPDLIRGPEARMAVTLL